MTPTYAHEKSHTLAVGGFAPSPLWLYVADITFGFLAAKQEDNIIPDSIDLRVNNGNLLGTGAGKPYQGAEGLKANLNVSYNDTITPLLLELYLETLKTALGTPIRYTGLIANPRQMYRQIEADIKGDPALREKFSSVLPGHSDVSLIEYNLF